MAGKVERVRLEAAPPRDPCDGCRDCALRCMAGIPMTRREFDAIVDFLRTLDPGRVRRVLEQEKNVPWFEDIYRECCLFLDTVKQDCLIYPARPLICRLFGRVEWLPCPAEKAVPKLHDGLGVLREYARDVRKTFSEWQVETGLFDVKTLLGK